MTPSEPLLPPPPPPPPAGVLGAPPLSPWRPAVPLHEPLRTSPRTVALEGIALVTLALSITLDVLVGNGVDGVGIWFGLMFVGSRIVGWWYRTYTVTDSALELEEGFLQKRHRVVPFNRIQQVELRQQLLARLLGVSLVQVETAGDAGSTAVVLRFLEHPRAEALRDHLLAQQRRQRGIPSADPATDAGDLWRAGASIHREELVHLRTPQLVVSGLSSSGALFTAVAGLLGITAIALDAAASDHEALATIAVRGTAQTAVLLAIVAIVSVALTCLQRWGFALDAVGDDLHVSYGLFDRRQHTIPRHRLQHVQVIDNPVRRRLRLVTVRLYSAATPGRGESGSTHIEIPVLPGRLVDDVLEQAMGDPRWRRPELHPRPSAARRRAVLRRTVLTGALAALGAVAWWPSGAVLLPLAALGVPWGLWAQRRAGWSVEGPVLAFASGVLHHQLELIPRERVQSVRSTAGFWQRRAELHSLRIDVAGGRQLLRAAPGLMDLARGAPSHPAAIPRSVP